MRTRFQFLKCRSDLLYDGSKLRVCFGLSLTATSSGHLHGTAALRTYIEWIDEICDSNSVRFSRLRFLGPHHVPQQPWTRSVAILRWNSLWHCTTLNREVIWDSVSAFIVARASCIRLQRSCRHWIAAGRRSYNRQLVDYPGGEWDWDWKKLLTYC